MPFGKVKASSLAAKRHPTFSATVLDAELRSIKGLALFLPIKMGGLATQCASAYQVAIAACQPQQRICISGLGLWICGERLLTVPAQSPTVPLAATPMNWRTELPFAQKNLSCPHRIVMLGELRVLPWPYSKRCLILV